MIYFDFIISLLTRHGCVEKKTYRKEENEAWGTFEVLERMIENEKQV